MHTCEVVIAHFIYGSQTCDVVATKKISDAGEEYYVCDEHFRQWVDNIEKEMIRGFWQSGSLE